MAEHKNIPELRFAEFEGNWIEKKMGEVFINSRKKGDNTLPIYSVSQELGLIPRESLERSIQKDADSELNLAVNQNDLVYNMMRMWQGAFGIAKIDCMVSPAYIVLKPNNKEFAQFYSYLLSKRRSQYLFWAYSYGLTNDRLRLYFKDFASIKRSAPILIEQQKIASFFTAIDQKISQLKQKKSLLAHYKKGVMQKIFFQKIRFKDDNGREFPNWEKKKIKDLAEIKYGKDQKQISCENGKYPILGTGGEMGRTNDFLTDKPSVLIGRKGTIDKPRYMDSPFWTVDTLFYTDVFANTNPKWLYYKFEAINWYLYNEASGVPSLSSSTIYTIPINLPILPEQIKIANFLSAIDDKIKQTKTQIENAQVWKKGMLQQMFV